MIYYVHCFWQSTQQQENYSNPLTITFQEDLNGRFALIYSQTVMTERISGLTVQIKVVALECESFMEKCRRIKKCHLNLIAFCKMWLKLLITLKNMSLTGIYSNTLWDRCKNIDIFFCT